MGKVLGRDAILGAKDDKTEVVTVEEWGGDVIVRSLTGHQRDRLTPMLARLDRGQADPDHDYLHAVVLVHSLIDEQGQPLFTRKDIEALSEKSGDVLDRLLNVAMRLSGMGATAKADAEKNSASGPNDSSGSDSPS